MLSTIQPIDYFALLFVGAVIFLLNKNTFGKNQQRNASHHSLRTRLISGSLIIIPILSIVLDHSISTHLSWVTTMTFIYSATKSINLKKKCRGSLKKNILIVPACFASNLIFTSIPLQPNMIHSIWAALILGVWLKETLANQLRLTNDLNAMRSKMLTLEAQSHNNELKALSKVPNDKWSKAS